MTVDKEILDYLLQLRESSVDNYKFVITRVFEKSNKIITDTSGGGGSCCPSPQPTGNGGTPNGDWECNSQNCQWVWVPDIG